MLGLTIHSKTETNKLQLKIPDELKGIDLQIIILPAERFENEEIEFYSEDELNQLNSINLGTPLRDNEDCSKW